MVRNKSKGPVAFAATQTSTLSLPRGGMLATGFWVLERPEAPPVLLRFQSARVPTVTARKLPGGGIRHEIRSRWDLYDMAQDSGMRPTRGVGQGGSVLRIDWPRNKNQRKTETCRTMVTIHH
jgi:hypothetical protein